MTEGALRKFAGTSSQLPMDSTTPSSRTRFPTALCVIVFGLLAWHGANEWQYAAWGKTTTAWVTNTSRSQEQVKSSTWYKLRITYVFTDADGVERRESDETSSRCGPPDGPQVGDAFQVQYLSKGTSRPASKADARSVPLCGLACAALFMWGAFSMLQSCD